MGQRNKCRSHIPEESLFLANEMNGQMPSVKWRLASPQRLGALSGKGPPGDHQVLEARGQDRWGRRVDRNGGSLAAPMGRGGPMAWAITAQWLQVFSRGPGQPLGWAGWAQTGSGAQDPSGGWGERSCLSLGPSTDEFKSKEGPRGGTGWAGATPFRAGGSGREGGPQPPAQSAAGPLRLGARRAGSPRLPFTEPGHSAPLP